MTAEKPKQTDDTASAPHLVLQGRYAVHLDSPVAVCDSALTQAFEARRTAGSSAPQVALLCTPDLPQRLAAVGRLRGHTIANTLPLGEAGIARYPQHIGRRYTVFLERPAGRRIVPRDEPSWPAMGENDVVEHVITPLLDALADLHREDVVHGAIRPDNLYFSGSAPSPAVLGEGVSAPTGTLQPLAIETIERGQATPSGRGEGTPAVDFYALGATVALLMRGSDPTGGKPAADVIAAKLRDGSFKVLCAGLRATPSMMQLLRGLLEDEPEFRWGRAQVEKWLSGASVTMPMPPARAKLPPLKFAGGQYDTLPAVAHALASRWRDAAKPIRSGALIDWLKQRPEYRGVALDIQALADDVAHDRLDDDALIARTIFRLDPDGPIRYRGVAVMPDGLGPGLAAIMAEGTREEQDAFADLMQSGLHVDYYDHRLKESKVPHRQRAVLKAQESNAAKRAPGLGLERSLYDLNPDLPCRSSLIGDRWVVSIDDLLPVLNALAQHRVPAEDPMDDHIAAFIANRLNVSTGTELSGLAAPSTRPHVRRLAVVALLALVYKRRNVAAVPALAQWLVARLDPVLDTIKNRDRRRQLADRLAITDSTVLLNGPSGSGKEVMAKYIHSHSNRSESPFVALNCAAIPENMLEATLFGYEKGSFTGAAITRVGRLELADGGTLFLDEIGDMSGYLQGKILRLL